LFETNCFPFFTPSFLVLLIPLLNLPVVSKNNVDLRIVLSKLFKLKTTYIYDIKLV
jgi:hypothetical protein